MADEPTPFGAEPGEGSDDGDDQASAEQKKRPVNAIGCIGGPAAVGLAMIAGGSYLLGRWEAGGGAARGGGIALVVVGSFLVLPMVLLLVLRVLIGYLLRRLFVKPLGEVAASAKRVVAQNKAMWAEEQERRPATDDDFAGLDRAWYDATTATLEGVGYRHLGDIVNETIALASGVSTVIRTLVSPDGQTLAGLYQVVSPRPGRDPLIVYASEFETEFEDATFLTASNAEAAGLAARPAAIDRRSYPAATPLLDLMRHHDENKAARLSANPANAAIVVTALDEAIASQHRQHLIKAAFRKGIGYVDPEEVRRVAAANGGRDAKTVGDLSAVAVDVARQWEQHQSDGVDRHRAGGV